MNPDDFYETHSFGCRECGCQTYMRVGQGLYCSNCGAGWDAAVLVEEEPPADGERAYGTLCPRCLEVDCECKSVLKPESPQTMTREELVSELDGLKGQIEDIKKERAMIEALEEMRDAMKQIEQINPFTGGKNDRP